MQLRRSEEMNSRFSGNGAVRPTDIERGALMHDYDADNHFELGDLADDSGDERQPAKRTSFDEGIRLSGRLSGTGRGRVTKESVKPKRHSSYR